MMNKKILPENLILESIKKENQNNFTDDKNFLFNNKNQIRFFTAITLPLLDRLIDLPSPVPLTLIFPISAHEVFSFE